MDRIAQVLTLVAVVLSGCATSGTSDQTASKKRAIVPPSQAAQYREFQYAPAMQAGPMLYLSGVVATVEDGESTLLPAIERAFDEIELILREAGADWSDVVDVTSYHTDLDNSIGPLWQIKGQRVPAPYPAWSAIGVDRLYGGEPAIIEIKVTAYRP
ncbi:MAG: Rid family hydrolase [Gammaproteobacteria bacterium]